jgi:hypothetical protein
VFSSKHVWVQKTIYGMLQAAVLWYQKLRSDLEWGGFDSNPYDPCVANCKVKGSQHIIQFPVDDDWISSHMDPMSLEDLFNHFSTMFQTDPTFCKKKSNAVP